MTDSPPLLAVVRIIVPVTLMVATAVLLKGYADTGDGFSAAVIVSLGALLLYTALGAEAAERLLPFRHAPVVAITGLAIALLVAFTPLLWGDALFTHSPPPGDKVIHIGTLELITAVAFDVGVFLLVTGSIIGAVRLIALPNRDPERPSA